MAIMEAPEDCLDGMDTTDSEGEDARRGNRSFWVYVTRNVAEAVSVRFDPVAKPDDTGWISAGLATVNLRSCAPWLRLLDPRRVLSCG